MARQQNIFESALNSGDAEHWFESTAASYNEIPGSNSKEFLAAVPICPESYITVLMLRSSVSSRPASELRLEIGTDRHAIACQYKFGFAKSCRSRNFHRFGILRQRAARCGSTAHQMENQENVCRRFSSGSETIKKHRSNIASNHFQAIRPGACIKSGWIKAHPLAQA
jgi:hypothetical protein